MMIVGMKIKPLKEKIYLNATIAKNLAKWKKIVFKRLGNKPISLKKKEKELMKLKVNCLLHALLQILNPMTMCGILTVAVETT